ncbi:hypothetical protein [Terasakiella pusilla]|uniref:hypothetical protein n=1 Tax=Terasakiella pusilla TaxID=64973 RepID=UPI00048DD634|nr:hypothetical protein [Terasakiella pusilla]
MARKATQLYFTDGNECWHWLGQMKSGEAVITRNGKRQSAKKFFYQQHHQVELDASDRLKNTCGHKGCLNPEHHRVRTDADRELTATKQWLFMLKSSLEKKEQTPQQIASLTTNIRNRAFPLLQTNDVGLIRGIVKCFQLARIYASAAQTTWLNEQMRWLISKEHTIQKNVHSYFNRHN